MHFNNLLKNEKLLTEPSGPSIFSLIQSSLRDLRTERKTLQTSHNEDSRSTVITETQETHLTDFSVESDVETHQPISPKEVSVVDVKITKPKIRSISFSI